MGERQQITKDIIVALIENKSLTYADAVVDSYKNIFSVVNESFSVADEEFISAKDFINNESK